MDPSTHCWNASKRKMEPLRIGKATAVKVVICENAAEHWGYECGVRETGLGHSVRPSASTAKKATISRTELVNYVLREA